jgi:hypothetical protein
MDPVHRTVDLFHRFFFRKIILKFIEKPWVLSFYRKPPVVYFNIASPKPG